MKNVITLSDGTECVSFVPNIERQLAIVDLQVLQKITQMLSRIDLSAVKQQMIDHIEQGESLQNVIDNMEEDIAFHKTVNLITLYKPD